MSDRAYPHVTHPRTNTNAPDDKHDDEKIMSDSPTKAPMPTIAKETPPPPGVHLPREYRAPGSVASIPSEDREWRSRSPTREEEHATPEQPRTRDTIAITRQNQSLAAQQQELADALGVKEDVIPTNPRVRDAEHMPKAFPSTFNPPPANTEHLLKSRGNAGAAGKQINIQEIGGAYGVYRH